MRCRCTLNGRHPPPPQLGVIIFKMQQLSRHFPVTITSISFAVVKPNVHDKCFIHCACTLLCMYSVRGSPHAAIVPSPERSVPLSGCRADPRVSRSGNSSSRLGSLPERPRRLPQNRCRCPSRKCILKSGCGRDPVPATSYPLLRDGSPVEVRFNGQGIHDT